MSAPLMCFGRIWGGQGKSQITSFHGSFGSVAGDTEGPSRQIRSCPAATFKSGNLISLHVYLCFIPAFPSPQTLPLSLPSRETKQADCSNKQWCEASR